MPAFDDLDLASDEDAKIATSNSNDSEASAWPLKTLGRAPPPGGELTDERRGLIQTLHRDSGEENFDVVLDGINVVSRVVNELRKSWKLGPRQWKWVGAVSVSS